MNYNEKLKKYFIKWLY